MEEVANNIAKQIERSGFAIAISSSSRNYGMAEPTAEALSEAGFCVYTPNFAYNETRRSVSAKEKRLLTLSFFEKLRRCDRLYVVVGKGYVGRSVCLEVGYAVALGKPIVLSEEAEELALMAVACDIVPLEKVVDYFAQHQNNDDRLSVAK